jgi:radical SAM protein with 4Fe4S-binding SPASM domain
LRLPYFLKILDLFPAAESVDLTGIGEPFCNPDFMEIVRESKRRGLYVEFANNGNLLSEERMDALIEMGVDNVQFSVDAATKETHEKIRAYSRFERVCEAIRKLGEKVGHSGAGKPDRRMTFTMSRENIAEAAEFVRLASRLGVRNVSYRDMLFFEGSGYSPADGIATLAADELAATRDAILKAAIAHRVDVVLSELLAGTAESRRTCRRPWMNAFVDVYGNLYPCCQVTQRNNDTTQYAMGNLLREEFTDVWNSQAYRQLRGDIVHPSAIPPLCEGCNMLKKVESRDAFAAEGVAMTIGNGAR